jgi:CBS domain-containing protein
MTPRPEDRVITIASTPVITLAATASLRDAACELRAANVGALLVLEEGARPLSVLSERDVVRALADGADPDEATAYDVMHQEPRYATPGQSIRSVGEEMLTLGVRHIPIVDEGEPIGMVAARDVMAVLAATLPHRPVPTPRDDGGAVLRELAHPGG